MLRPIPVGLTTVCSAPSPDVISWSRGGSDQHRGDQFLS